MKKAQTKTPSLKDIMKVIKIADPDVQDYLYTIKDTMARTGEINRLTWNDVDFKNRHIVFRNSMRFTSRKIPMTKKLYQILSHRYKNRDKEKTWVFWYRYWSKKEGKWIAGQYKDRKNLMKRLCEKAGIRYFPLHSMRLLGLSMLDNAKVDIRSIKTILRHDNIVTTVRYLDSIRDFEREAIIIKPKSRK